jgi:integrase
MISKKTLPAGLTRITINVPKDLHQDAYVSYWTTEGKRHRTSQGIGSQKTYEDRLQAALELKASIIDNFQPITPIEKRAWAWIESRKPFLRQKTIYGYQSKLRIFLEWKGTRAISRDLVSEYLAFRGGRVAGGTLHDDKIYLARIFNSLTPVKYFDHVELPGFHAETKRHYQSRHISIIREHLQQQDPMLWFACQCVYYLFIRPGSELRLLQGKHFDIDNWRVNVPADISKTARNEFIKIPPGFREEVEAFVADVRPSDYVFPGVFDDTRPIGKNTMMTRYRKHMQHLGFHDYTMYGWKNTGGIDLAKKNVNPKKLQIQMRHSSLEMTDRYLRRMGFNDLTDDDLNFTKI